MLPTYTLKMELLFDEELVKDFLIAVTDAVNGMGKKVVKTKTKIRKHKKYFVIIVKVKFEDGTKMKFKNKYELDIDAGVIELTPQEIAKAMGHAPQQLQETENTIGFKLD